MTKIRTFISFDPPDAVHRKIVALQEELKQYRGDVKWENQKQMHVTITFLGDVEESLLPEVIAITEKCARTAGKITVSFQELGAFPNRKRPRVLWVGCVNADGMLGKLKEELETRLTPLGFPPEERAFHPHITLGRVRERGDVRNLLPILEKRTFEPQTAIIDGIFVMKSMLSPSGAEHTIIKAISLS